MKKNLTGILLSCLLLITITQHSYCQILISGFLANPASTDSPYEYVQLKATQAINFSTTNYCVVWCTNGNAIASGWVAGGSLTYGFNLTSGSVAAGDVFYVGGTGKRINGSGSTDISGATWIRTINTGTTAGDGFGTASSGGVFGNGGSNADGVGVFTGLISSLTSTTLPIDAIFYGSAVGSAVPATGGYVLPNNDHYLTAQGTYGNGTNTWMGPDPGSNDYVRLTGTYNSNSGSWTVIRTGSIQTLSATSQLADIASLITLVSGDITPPTVSSVSIINSTTIKVVFSEAVTSSTAQNTANYTGVGALSTATLSGTDTVTLALNAAVTAGQSYTLTISNIADMANNLMSAPYTYTYIYNNTIGQLVINEIMYDDPGSGVDSLEFIELYNAGATSIALGGYHFTGAVTYAFPPLAMAAGTYIVLSKYPSLVNSFFSITSTGWTSGTLDNNGATITILNTTSDVVDVVTYSNVSPWPTEPNGNGPSLILCDPLSDNSLASNWSYSVTPAGIYQSATIYATPGAANVCPLPNADVSFKVNMSHYHAIGLFDPSTDFVDITGSFNSWGSTLLSGPNSDMIYTVTLPQLMVTTTLQFKFRINGSNAPATVEFPSGPNRTYTVIDGVNNMIYWYNDVTGNVSVHDVQYTTDISGDSPLRGFYVTTRGVVTGKYNAAGYFIQDGTGEWNGVFVYDVTNQPALGDSVTITGLVDEYNNMTEIKSLTSFIINSSSNPLPAPVILTTSQVSQTDGYEGVLVTVHNAACTNNAYGNGEWLVDDSSGDCVVDDMGLPYSAVVGDLYDVTGPVYYSLNMYKIEPRFSADIADVTVVPETQVINLVQGWSIFSTYVAPTNPAIDVVMASIVSDILIIKNGPGQVYWPAYGVNQIGNMAVGSGYQIKSLAAIPLNIAGMSIIPQNTPISLPQGWSMIAYLRNTNGNIVTMMSGIVSNIALVKSGAGLVYWPYYNLNGIGNMIPGQGYQIYLYTASTLTYPANTVNSAK
ncbi:MAG: lamin tail domain-containing protein [Bacteroidia bacterium]|nr:lamin tail domain-containing protein [Bacteroidia bacterium]